LAFHSLPHPFISLLSVNKGKRLLPRIFRLTNSQQTLTIVTLLVATFDTLDVVKYADKFDLAAGGSENTEAFLNSAVPVLMSAIGAMPLRIVGGMVSLLLKRNDVVRVARSRVSCLMELFLRCEFSDFLFTRPVSLF
jgi:DNA topoisomerase 2-associated protein PAT1